LPNSRVNNGHELLRLFLGMSHSVNWILSDSETFFDVLCKLDEETRRIVLFQIKMEIEEYYNSNYLTEE
jgi:hypothetical protein